MARGKPRRWSNLKGEVPEPVVEMNERTRTMLERKDERAATPMPDLVQEWETLEEEESFEDLAKYDRNITFEALEKRILDELAKVQQVAGTDMWRGDGHTFSPKHILSPHVVDPSALLKWVHETDQAHLLTVPTGRLKSIVAEAMNADHASTMTPAQRAALKPGEPGSMQPPPGVAITLHTTVHHTSPKARKRRSVESDDEPF